MWLQDGDELLEGRRISMSPEAVPAFEVEILTGSAAREADRLLQVFPFLRFTETCLVVLHISLEA